MKERTKLLQAMLVCPSYRFSRQLPITPCSQNGCQSCPPKLRARLVNQRLDRLSADETSSSRNSPWVHRATSYFRSMSSTIWRQVRSDYGPAPGRLTTAITPQTSLYRRNRPWRSSVAGAPPTPLIRERNHSFRPATRPIVNTRLMVCPAQFRTSTASTCRKLLTGTIIVGRARFLRERRSLTSMYYQ